MIKSYQKNCFREHIQESIAINRERKQVYGRLTNGRSDKIFNFLITFEYATLVTALYYDVRASRFQKKGLELFCHEFMSMNKVGEFSAEALLKPISPVVSFDWRAHKKRLELALQNNNPTLIRAACVAALLELKSQPQYFAMTRHLIESIFRFAYCIPLREKEALKLGVPSPRSLMFDVMRLHLLGFSGSYEIDQWSAPLQLDGVPLLISELPDLLQDLDDPELEALRH